MHQLNELTDKFEAYLSKVFPDFQQLSIAGLAPLAQIKEKLDMRRPLIAAQTIDNSVEDCLAQIEVVSPQTEANEVNIVLDNAKNILVFKQKVLEANNKSFGKFCGLSQVQSA